MPESTATPESDPMALLREMVARGAGNTPDAIMLRLLWLRQDHPDAQVATEALHIADDRVVIRASITLSDGGSGSGIAAAAMHGDDDWAAHVEGTETIAISRALDTLGYVLRAATEQAAPVSVPEDITPRPESVPESAPERTPVREPEHPAPSLRQDPGSTPPPRPEPARMQEAAPPVVNALRRARRPQSPDPPPGAGTDEDDAHLEEYSWNSFWTRARELGLSPQRVTEILGRQANATTPRETIEELIAADAWPRDPGS